MDAASQETDMNQYYEVYQSLLNSKKQWTAVPQIIHLTFQCLRNYIGCLQDEMTAVRNEFSSINNILVDLQKNKHLQKMEVQNKISATPIRQSRYSSESKLNQEEGLDKIMIEEVKTLCLALIQVHEEREAETRTIQTQKMIGQVIRDIKRDLKQVQNSLVLTQKNMQNMADRPLQPAIQQVVQPDPLSIKIQQDIKQVKAELSLIQRNLAAKLDKSLYDEDIKALKQRQVQQSFKKSNSSQVESLKKVVEELLVKKADSKQLTDFKNKTTKSLAEKIKLQEVEEIIKSFQSQMNNQVTQCKAECKKIQKQLSKLIKLEVESLQQKIKRDGSPASKKTSSSISEIKSSLSRVERKIHQRLIESRETTEKQSEQQDFQDQLDRQWNRMIEQLDMRDRKLCQTIEQTLESSRNVIETRITKAKPIEKEKQSVTLLNALCKQLILGKWTCNSKPLISNTICWENQISNTNKENFIWTDTNILVVAPGVYRLQFAFFSPFKNNPTFYLNGEMILQPVDQTIEINRKHPNGCVSGQTVSQVILLPARGRLTVRMSKDSPGQAYLGLYKL